MIVRGVGRAVAGLILVAAVAACDDNPLSENREDGAYFRLSSTNAVVQVHDTIQVVANVLNQFGASLATNVTATACDANVSVMPDTSRSEYEPPENFLIAGNSFGESCVVVTGAGVTDTINVRVVPASIDVSFEAPGDTLVQSGDSISLQFAYLGAGGAAAPGVGFDSRTTFAIRTGGTGTVSAAGNFIGQTPGTTWVVVTFSDLGVSRRDSLQITVEPGVFTGSAAQISYANGEQAIEFTPGAIPFDENTRVEFPDEDVGEFVHLLPNSTTVRAAIPGGTAAGTQIRYFIINAGPLDFTVEGTFTTTAAAPAVDVSPNVDDLTAIALDVGEDWFGMITGVRGSEEWFVVNVTEAGVYNIEFSWGDDLDKDAYVLDSAGNVLLALENGASTNPESDDLELEPGTYYLVGSTWTPNPGDAAFYRMRFTKVEDDS